MVTPRPVSQREVMRTLWRTHAPDEEGAVREYAAREDAGEVTRNSNNLNIPSLEYARRLLNDGLRKGWLDNGVARQGPSQPAANASATAGLTQTARNASPRSIPPVDGRPWRDWAADAMRALGCAPESVSYLERVRQWRTVWRPARVRTLLIAESHVGEHPGDAEVSVDVSSISPATEAPAGFCRLVYCLGYGESALCRPQPPDANDGGTWQYWDLFGAIACAYDSSITASMPRRSKSDLRTRLAWKLQVLATLQRAGVWLEDASIIALYSPGGTRRAGGRSYHDIVRTSFESFVWPGVAADEPEQVWVVGRGVADALRGLPMIADERVISQPQDRDHKRFRVDVERLRNTLPRMHA